MEVFLLSDIDTRNELNVAFEHLCEAVNGLKAIPDDTLEQPINKLMVVLDWLYDKTSYPEVHDV